MIETYNFAGDAVTYAGALGVASSAIILRTVFARYAKYQAICKKQDDSFNYDTYAK